jgi:hypothetical protein
MLPEQLSHSQFSWSCISLPRMTKFLLNSNIMVTRTHGYQESQNAAIQIWLSQSKSTLLPDDAR